MMKVSIIIIGDQGLKNHCLKSKAQYYKKQIIFQSNQKEQQMLKKINQRTVRVKMNSMNRIMNRTTKKNNINLDTQNE